MFTCLPLLPASASCPWLLLVEAQLLSFQRFPGDVSVILVVKNVVLRQRAAVYVSDGGLHGHSVLEARVPVELSVWHGQRGLRHRPGGRADIGGGAVGLAVDAVQVLGDADAASIHQELRQEAAL